MVVATDNKLEVATLSVALVSTSNAKAFVGVTPTVNGYVDALIEAAATAATSVYAAGVSTLTSVSVSREIWMAPAVALLALRRAKGMLMVVPFVVAGTAQVPPLEPRTIVATVVDAVVETLQYVAVEMVTAVLAVAVVLNTVLSAVNFRTLLAFSGLPEVYDTTSELVGVAPMVSGATAQTKAVI